MRSWPEVLPDRRCSIASITEDVRQRLDPRRIPGVVPSNAVIPLLEARHKGHASGLALAALGVGARKARALCSPFIALWGQGLLQPKEATPGPEAPGAPRIGEDQEDVGSIPWMGSGESLLLEAPCIGSKATLGQAQKHEGDPSRHT